jgi:hypothetical protein
MASNWLATFASHDAVGTLYENTIGVKMDPTSGDGLSAGDLADAVYSWVGSEYNACLSGLLTLDTLTVRKMPFPVTEEGVHAINTTGGGANDDNWPREIALICAWKTDHPGRSGRGHIALPAPRKASTLYAGNSVWVLTNAYFTTTVQAFYDALDAGADWGPGGADGHISHIVYSRKDDAGYDVKARVSRAGMRWVERRQTIP